MQIPDSTKRAYPIGDTKQTKERSFHRILDTYAASNSISRQTIRA